MPLLWICPTHGFSNPRAFLFTLLRLRLASTWLFSNHHRFLGYLLRVQSTLWFYLESFLPITGLLFTYALLVFQLTPTPSRVVNLLPSLNRLTRLSFWTIWLLSHTTSLRSSHHAKFLLTLFRACFLSSFSIHTGRVTSFLITYFLGNLHSLIFWGNQAPFSDFSYFFGYCPITVITVSTVIRLTPSASVLPTPQRGFFFSVVTTFVLLSRAIHDACLFYCLLSRARIHDVCICSVEYGLPYILSFSIVGFTRHQPH